MPLFDEILRVRAALEHTGIESRIASIEGKQIWTIKSVRSVNGLSPDDLGNVKVNAGTWGQITGDIDDQADLQEELASLVPYSGAISDMNLGSHTVTAQAFLPSDLTDIGGSTTPDISVGNSFTCTNSTPTTITNFINGTAGQTITITFQDGNTTISNNSNIVLSGGTNYNPPTNTGMSLQFDGATWNEVGRSSSGAGNITGLGSANRMAMWTSSTSLVDVPIWPIQLDICCEII